MTIELEAKTEEIQVKKPVSVMDEVPRELLPYVKAMSGASGLSEFDAITSVLFAIATHMDLEIYPILIYQGQRGTGKSEAMKQLFKMCRGATKIEGTTCPAHRNALNVGVRTAFVDEADSIENTVTDLYTKRYSRETGTIQVNIPVPKKGYELVSQTIFGATVMGKRTPIADVALRSRAIIIRTNFHEPHGWKIANTGDVAKIASEVEGRVKYRIKEIGGIDRVQDTWNPLYLIAEQLSMTLWKNEALNVISREAEALKGGQGYEPSEAILQAICILSIDEVSKKRVDASIRISGVVKIVKDEFALNLKPGQIKDEAEAKGFQTGLLKGYPIIKVKKDLLDKLLPEEG